MGHNKEKGKENMKDLIRDFRMILASHALTNRTLQDESDKHVSVIYINPMQDNISKQKRNNLCSSHNPKIRL